MKNKEFKERRKGDRREDPNKLRKWFENKIIQTLKDGIKLILEVKESINEWKKLVSEIKEIILTILEDPEVKEYLEKKYEKAGNLWIIERLNKIESWFDKIWDNAKETENWLKSVSKVVEKWIEVVEMLQWENIRDKLTWAFNRRFLELELERLITGGIDFKLIFLDIDKFKPLNELHWHRVWDKCLIHLTNILFDIFWNPDNTIAYNDDKNKVCRYWWDEFVIIQCWENINHDTWDRLIHNRLASKKWSFSFKDKKQNIVNKNIEVSTWYDWIWENETPLNFLERIDKKMQESKEKARRA